MNSGEEQAENLVKRSEEKKGPLLRIFSVDKSTLFSPFFRKTKDFLTLALLKVVPQPKSVSYMANMIFGCHGKHVLYWRPQAQDW